MKNKVIYIVLFCILLIGGGTLHIKAIQTTLKVIDSQTTVKRGETGFITIEGKSNTKYVIETTFRANNQVINITQTRISGSDGRATFRWTVSPQTESGTRSAIIFGGNEHVTLSHTVP